MIIQRMNSPKVEDERARKLNEPGSRGGTLSL